MSIKENETSELPVKFKRFKQVVYPMKRGSKKYALLYLLQIQESTTVLVFVKNSKDAQMVETFLKEAGVEVLKILTDESTDSTDATSVERLINYDLPSEPQIYAKRLEQFGTSAETISLVSADEFAMLNTIEGYVRRKIPQMSLSGFELYKEAPKEVRVERGAPEYRHKSYGSDAKKPFKSNLNKKYTDRPNQRDEREKRKPSYESRKKEWSPKESDSVDEIKEKKPRSFGVDGFKRVKKK